MMVITAAKFVDILLKDMIHLFFENFENDYKKYTGKFFLSNFSGAA